MALLISFKDIMASTKKPLPSLVPTQQKHATEADAKAGGTQKEKNHSSHDAKSHTKAGSSDGAGGGKKQERKH